jgi:hypothetical protein
LDRKGAVALLLEHFSVLSNDQEPQRVMHPLHEALGGCRHPSPQSPWQSGSNENTVDCRANIFPKAPTFTPMVGRPRVPLSGRHATYRYVQICRVGSLFVYSQELIIISFDINHIL